MADDRWPELLKLANSDVGEVVRDCGSWTENKLWFWNRYIDVVVSSMTGKPGWSGVCYVDLFAGPGICKLRDSGKLLPGSSLIAAHARKPLAAIHAVELDSENARALDARLKASPASSISNVYRGDCNVCIKDVANALLPKALTLAFVDPPNLDIHFDTIRTLTDGRRVDLLILIADQMDIVRNVDVYEAGYSDKLDKMLPPSAEWRREWGELENRSADKICDLFSRLYKESLRKELGYEYFREKSIRSAKSPLYRLLFASKHELGTTFWDRVTKKDKQGQVDLF